MYMLYSLFLFPWFHISEITYILFWSIIWYSQTLAKSSVVKGGHINYAAEHMHFPWVIFQRYETTWAAPIARINLYIILRKKKSSSYLHFKRSYAHFTGLLLKNIVSGHLGCEHPKRGSFLFKIDSSTFNDFGYIFIFKIIYCRGYIVWLACFQTIRWHLMLKIEIYYYTDIWC